ncbi:hypothetical protein ASPCADRAFT_131880 [Aspergillus carbonarius ITEM 5010]|uniref:Hydrophobin n=1 Tax=Aspergillus carbonarius (strain ITEM 5010) TaxID=602072 RepID=A0A1R3RIL6_ASPC5|nr:hypothetical protein ASPCADRAFT_131880 [Aspergillus carbonarius ITEM 5010]
MHYPIFLTLSLALTLTTLTPVATSIPLSSSTTNTQSQPQSTPSSTSINTPEALESAISNIIVQETITDFNNSTCPPSHRSKQCCESIDNIADQVTDGIGQILPWISGVDVSSVLGLDCYAMADSTPNNKCLQQVMCCDGKPNDEDQPTTQSGAAVTSSCESWDIAMKNKQDAIDQSMAREHAVMDAVSSFSAAAVATPTSSSASTSGAVPAASSSGVLGRRVV